MRLSMETVLLLSSMGDKKASAAYVQLRKSAAAYMVSPKAVAINWRGEQISVDWRGEEMFMVQTQWD